MPTTTLQLRTHPPAPAPASCGPKGPPSAPPTIPPIIINPFTRGEAPRPVVDPPGRPLRPPPVPPRRPGVFA